MHGEGLAFPNAHVQENSLSASVVPQAAGLRLHVTAAQPLSRLTVRAKGGMLRGTTALLAVEVDLG